MRAIAATISLTRWREHVNFVIPLSLLGAILGSISAGRNLDFRFVAIVIANVLAVAYAFMINDIEDAPDDALDPKRARKNVIASGQLGHKSGYLACQLVAIASLVFYTTGGLIVLLLGAATLLLSHFYSARPTRLKAYPVTDIVSHVLMLSTLLLLAGFYTYSTRPGSVWWVVAAATFVSGYGQLYNQLRDFTIDKKAGLKNTSILIGKKRAQMLMYFALGVAIVCILGAIASGIFPLWLLIIILVILPVSKMWGKETDTRGSKVFESTGAYQNQATLIFNAIVIAWLLQVIIGQYIL